MVVPFPQISNSNAGHAGSAGKTVLENARARKCTLGRVLTVQKPYVKKLIKILRNSL